MRAFRHLLARRHLAAVICAAALLLKLLVPTGYMIDSYHGRPAIVLCPGTVPAAAPTHMTGMHGATTDHDKSPDHPKAEMPCAFAGLSAAALGAIDPVQLAALLAFVLAVGFATTIGPAPSHPAHLRPPSRGPPIRP